MSYVKKTWKNRQSEYPTRRKLVATGTVNEYDVVRAEGADVYKRQELHHCIVCL